MLSIVFQTSPVTWWWDSAVWSNALSPTMSSLVSSLIKLLLRGLKYSFEVSNIFCQNMCRCGHAGVLQISRGLRKNPQRCRCQVQECISHFKVFHTAVFPLVPLRLMPCPVIAGTINSSSELISYLIHFLSEPVTPLTTTSVSTVREEYSAVPRFHSSIVWLFLI